MEKEAVAKKPRIISIDVLRGVVMIIMVLDHVREFFSSVPFSPTDLAHTTPVLFLTRWVTHFCAPVFVFFAGVSAYLYASRGKSKAELSHFLWTRGLFLVFAELVIVRFCCSFNFDYSDINANILQVIWAIGWSMVFLAGLVRLPLWGIVAFGGLMVLGHNLLDGIEPAALGAWGPLFILWHVRDVITLVPALEFKVVYPLIPWVGVMALGYAFGRLMLLEEIKRRKIFWGMGLTLALLFVGLRMLNLYGDPMPWSVQKDPLWTVFSFLNCQKYPPSLLFLLMTLGPSLMVLSLIGENEGRISGGLAVFGRVAFFFYITHLLAVHLLALLFAVIKYGYFPAWMFRGNPIFSTPNFPEAPAGYGYGLGVVYLVWIVVVVALFPLCRWYMNFKRTHPSPLLSYI